MFKQGIAKFFMHTSDHQPAIAIIDTNTLAAIGLRQILQQTVPFAAIDCLTSMDELMMNGPEQYAHFFVSTNLALANMTFFQAQRNRTIILTASSHTDSHVRNFNSLNTNVPEKELLRSLLALFQHAHAHGEHMPKEYTNKSAGILSNREIEVLALIVQGYINKEIADRLHISLTTVISHRKNIMDKLNLRSVSALTIYAVMNGYVDISQI